MYDCSILTACGGWKIDFIHTHESVLVRSLDLIAAVIPAIRAIRTSRAALTARASVLYPVPALFLTVGALPVRVAVADQNPCRAGRRRASGGSRVLRDADWRRRRCESHRFRPLRSHRATVLVLTFEVGGRIPPVPTFLLSLEECLQLINLVVHVLPRLVQHLLIRVRKGEVLLLTLNVSELCEQCLVKERCHGIWGDH
jgi:hypothetical protein